MRRICEVTKLPFDVSSAEEAYCAQFGVPLPTQSPWERLRQLAYFRNRINLYHTQCALTGKKILTSVAPDTGFKSADVEAWSSDCWDPCIYGRPYNFHRPFFEQYAELQRVVPIINLHNSAPTLENSDYINGATGAKNCYLVFSAEHNEDCMVCHSIRDSKNIVDCVFAHRCELCFDCVDVSDSYNLVSSEHCSNCHDSSFLYNCHGCRNCHGCVNLTRKQYCLYNEQLSAEAYEGRMHEIDLGSYRIFIEERERLGLMRREYPLKFCFGLENENSTGNFISNTKNCKNCWFVTKAEDVEWSITLGIATSSMFVLAYGTNVELCYNCVSIGDNSYHLRFCDSCWMNVRDLEYCSYCGYGVTDCFGCVGLRHASYCILNQQYSKSEYFELIRRIKAQMLETGDYGRFFPNQCSPHYYNRCSAAELFPLSAEQAKLRGFRWLDEPPVEEFAAAVLPDRVSDGDDQILGQTFCCSISKKPFRIGKVELDFYRRRNLPLPRQSPIERIRSKLGMFTLHPLEERQCSRCQVSFQTSLTKEPQALICEQCFQELVS